MPEWLKSLGRNSAGGGSDQRKSHDVQKHQWYTRTKRYVGACLITVYITFMSSKWYIGMSQKQCSGLWKDISILLLA